MNDEFGIEPRGKRRVAWWVAALVLVATVVVVALVQEGSADDALLTEDDFGRGYEVVTLTRDELTRADAGLPSGIEPAECTELLRARPQAGDTGTVSGVAARREGAAYLEVLMPADQTADWDVARLDDVAGRCQNTTFPGGTVEFSRLDAPGFAFAARVSSGDGVVTVGVAMARVEAHVVVLTGVAQGDLDRREFTRLARAAGDRVSAEL
jgi:hypothetical protein